MVNALLTAVFDLLIPPRGSERMVRELTLSQLQSLDSDGGLPYHDPRVTGLVWELKYYASPRAAALAAAIVSEKILAAASEELGQPLLVPVPMHASRRKQRGHNQTEVLCKAALKTLGDAVEYAPRALKRVRATHTQQGQGRHKRLKNVRGSMEALPTVVGERVCIVVDDVTTTGATLEEAKRALRSAGARAVHCVVVARS